jgi:hypothetical protein
LNSQRCGNNSQSRLSYKKLLFHFWIVLSIGVPPTGRRPLLKLTDLLVEIVRGVIRAFIRDERTGGRFCRDR